MRKTWPLLFALGALSACNGAMLAQPEAGRPQGGAIKAGTGACPELPATDNTKLGLIHQMLEAGKPHAALAYLDAAAIDAPQARLLRANALRQTGSSAQASALYQDLTGSCVSGYAYQGLGLIANRAGRQGEALRQLRAATQALPVDAAIRNDYGYALMQAGELQAAQHEFLTAIELGQNNRRAVNNLIVLLLRQGENDQALAFAEQFKVPAQALDELKMMARAPLSEAGEERGVTTGMTTGGGMNQSMQEEAGGASK